MPERRLAIELIFNDDFALLDFQEGKHDLQLLEMVRHFVETSCPGAKVTDDFLTRNNQTGEWSSMGFRGPMRPSEEAIARMMEREHPDKTHFQIAREQLKKDYAEREAQRQKDAEYLELLQAAEEEEERNHGTE